MDLIAKLLLTGAAITKYHRVGDLNNRNLFPHSSAGWKSKVKVWAGSSYLEDSSWLGRWVSSLCVVCILIFWFCLFIWAPGLLDESPSIWPYYPVITSKRPSHSLLQSYSESWILGLQHVNFGQDTIQPITLTCAVVFIFYHLTGSHAVGV